MRARSLLDINVLAYADAAEEAPKQARALYGTVRVVNLFKGL